MKADLGFYKSTISKSTISRIFGCMDEGLEVKISKSNILPNLRDLTDLQIKKSALKKS